MADKRDTTAELLARFLYAEGHRQDYDIRALENYRLYTGYRDPLPKELRGRSNLHIPKTYELIRTIRARYLLAIFSTSPVVEFIPNPLLYFQESISAAEYLQMLLSAEDSAKYATYLIDQQLRNSAAFRKLYDFITATLVFPAGVMAVGWKYEQKKMKQHGREFSQEFGVEIESIVENHMTTYDDNELAYVDYYDFWPDPRGTDIDNCRFVFSREWVTETELKAKLEVLDRAGSGTVYQPESWDALTNAGSHLQGGATERLTEVGYAGETSQGYWSEPRKGYQIELLHYWENDRHAIIANRFECLFDGTNPYWHGKKPFLVASYDPRPGEFYGFSAVELIEHLQHELNTTRNQRIDNVSFVLNRMWKVRRGADIDENELVSRPHGIVYVDSPDDVVEMAMNEITGSSYREEEIIKNDMQDVLGAPEVVRGVEASRRQTATEITQKTSSADVKFQVAAMLYEEVLNRMAELMDMNNQQFITNPRIFKAEEEWKVVTPDEIRGHHLYRPKSSNQDMSANREIRRQQLLELQKLLQGHPNVEQMELLKLVLEAYGLRGTERILIEQPQVPTLPGGIPGQPQLGGQGVPQEMLATLMQQAQGEM